MNNKQLTTTSKQENMNIKAWFKKNEEHIMNLEEIHSLILHNTMHSNDCWIWTKDETEEQKMPKHKTGNYIYELVYIHSFGSIPHNHKLIHACPNKQCVNPNHMFLFKYGEK